jgi:hypothetical protein
VFVAVELKSCGSYLQVAQTKCTELSTTPVWNEVNIYLLFIIMYISIQFLIVKYKVLMYMCAFNIF